MTLKVGSNLNTLNLSRIKTILQSSWKWTRAHIVTSELWRCLKLPLKLKRDRKQNCWWRILIAWSPRADWGAPTSQRRRDKFWVYHGIKTCGVFLCFAAIVRVKSIILILCFLLHRGWAQIFSYSWLLVLYFLGIEKYELAPTKPFFD